MRLMRIDYTKPFPEGQKLRTPEQVFQINWCTPERARKRLMEEVLILQDNEHYAMLSHHEAGDYLVEFQNRNSVIIYKKSREAQHKDSDAYNTFHSFRYYLFQKLYIDWS